MAYLVMSVCFCVITTELINNLPEHYIHCVLRQTWILKPGLKDTNHKSQSTMYGFVVPSSYIHMLATYIAFMLNCVAGTFWYKFLLEETIQHSCTPSGVECFSYTSFWDLFTFVEPIDCNHVPSGVSTFTCYKYKFDINGALWTAGCVLAISTFIIKVLPACFLFLRRYNAQMYRILRYPIVLLCLLFIKYLGLIISTVKNTTENTTIVFEFCSISLGILLSLTVLFLDFKPIPASRHQ